MEYIITAFLFGLFAGFLPGPILTSGFMTILGNPKGFQKILPFPLIAGSVEIIIGLFILYIGKEFFTPIILIALSILGAINLIYLAYKIFSKRKTFSLFSTDKKIPEKVDENYMAISYIEVFMLTTFNGPLYMFWITTCLPILLQAENQIANGGTYFTITMVFGVMISTWSLFYIMHISRNYLQNPKLMRIIPVIISTFFILMAGKMIQTIFILL